MLHSRHHFIPKSTRFHALMKFNIFLNFDLVCFSFEFTDYITFVCSFTERNFIITTNLIYISLITISHNKLLIVLATDTDVLKDPLHRKSLYYLIIRVCLHLPIDSY